MARKKDFMKFEFLKDLSGATPEEIAANGGPTTFEGQPGLMEEVVIKNIATDEETVVSQVVVKAPVPAQTIAMDEDPSKNDLVGNKPPFNHQSPFAHPSRPNFPGAYFANNSQDHLRPKAAFHPHQDDSQAKVDFMKEDQSDDKQFEGRGITIEELLSAMGDGSEIRFVPMHDELPGRPPQFSPEQLRSMSIARELDGENEHPQGFEAFKGLFGL